MCCQGLVYNYRVVVVTFVLVVAIVVGCYWGWSSLWIVVVMVGCHCGCSLLWLSAVVIGRHFGWSSLVVRFWVGHYSLTVMVLDRCSGWTSWRLVVLVVGCRSPGGRARWKFGRRLGGSCLVDAINFIKFPAFQ